MINFFIKGLPVPQGRARATIVNHLVRGPRVRVYDPKKSRDWKEYVAWEAQQHPECPPEPSESPLRAVFTFYLQRPKGLAKKRRNDPHVKKPDCTNLVKGIEDALEGILYKNDSQIFDIRIIKQYGDTPGVQIELEEFKWHQ